MGRKRGTAESFARSRPGGTSRAKRKCEKISTAAAARLFLLLAQVALLPQNVYGDAAFASSTLTPCVRQLDCVSGYEFCVKGQCVRLENSAGLEAWVLGSALIGGLLVLCTVLGCLCLHPSSRHSRRYAHPKDRRFLGEQEQEQEPGTAGRQQETGTADQEGKGGGGRPLGRAGPANGGRSLLARSQAGPAGGGRSFLAAAEEGQTATLGASGAAATAQDGGGSGDGDDAKRRMSSVSTISYIFHGMGGHKTGPMMPETF